MSLFKYVFTLVQDDLGSGSPINMVILEQEKHISKLICTCITEMDENFKWKHCEALHYMPVMYLLN